MSGIICCFNKLYANYGIISTKYGNRLKKSNNIFWSLPNFISIFKYFNQFEINLIPICTLSFYVTPNGNINIKSLKGNIDLSKMNYLSSNNGFYTCNMQYFYQLLDDLYKITIPKTLTYNI